MHRSYLGTSESEEYEEEEGEEDILKNGEYEGGDENTSYNYTNQTSTDNTNFANFTLTPDETDDGDLLEYMTSPSTPSTQKITQKTPTKKPGTVKPSTKVATTITHKTSDEYVEPALPPLHWHSEETAQNTQKVL